MDFGVLVLVRSKGSQSQGAGRRRMEKVTHCGDGDFEFFGLLIYAGERCVCVCVHVRCVILI